VSDSPVGYLLLFGVAGFIIYQIYLGAKAPRKKVCKSCGFLGVPDSTTPGSLAIEIVLWLCLIVPGLIYSLWRANSRHDICAKCGGAEVIPADSPIGKNIIANINDGGGRSP